MFLETNRKTMMRAAMNSRYGAPEVVQIAETPIPSPKKGEILIEVLASTVNRTDCGFRSAQYFISRFFSGLFYPKNKVLGCEFAGKVLRIGEDVEEYKIGDLVFGFDDSNFGGHAEYKVVDPDKVASIPPGISVLNAAALTEGSHYALCNIRAAKVKSGDQVLVYGASGAIGSAAVQLLKHLGVFVVAVAGTAHQDLLLKLGADEIWDYQKQDMKQITHQFDFIFDAVGKLSFAQCKPMLKSKGIYISTELGKGSQNVFLALWTPIWSGKKVLFPLPSISKADLIFLRDLAEQGAFVPLIDRNYSLEDIVEAYRYVETGQKVGNVLIDMRRG